MKIVDEQYNKRYDALNEQVAKINAKKRELRKNFVKQEDKIYAEIGRKFVKAFNSVQIDSKEEVLAFISRLAENYFNSISDTNIDINTPQTASESATDSIETFVSQQDSSYSD